jgi:hypothetical protein
MLKYQVQKLTVSITFKNTKNWEMKQLFFVAVDLRKMNYTGS